jgi:phenylacetate-CoA ligase
LTALSRIYERSPRFLRSVYVNAFGLRNVPRFRRWEKLLDGIEYTETMDKQDQIEYVEKRLIETIRHAIEEVPFYRKFASLASELESRSVFDVLKEFPVIDKEAIIGDPSAFYADGHGDYVVSKTSGTTGTPLSVRMDRDTFLLGDALWWRRTRWNGYEDGDWIARLVGDPVIPLRISEPKKPWMISNFDRRIYLSTFHLSAETAVRIGELLNRKKPEYIMGYPSSLEILCNYLDESGYKVAWRPKNVIFSSEPMYDHQDRIIRKVFGTEIRGLYGSGERMVSAAQCPHGTYHLSLVDGFVEGQFGIMENIRPASVTALTNRVMPLIRYQLGDVIEIEQDAVCPCGRTLPVMSPVITKDEDWIITPTGRKISPSAVVWAFIHQEIDGITNGQVVQHDEEKVTVYLNTSEENFLKYKDVLHKSMDKVFFNEMKVEVVRTDSVDLMESGKSRFIVNKLKKRN